MLKRLVSKATQSKERKEEKKTNPFNDYNKKYERHYDSIEYQNRHRIYACEVPPRAVHS